MGRHCRCRADQQAQVQVQISVPSGSSRCRADDQQALSEAQRELGASHAALFDVQARYFEALDQVRVAAAVVYLQRRWRNFARRGTCLW